MNQIEGDVSGLEGWANWQATPAWRLSAGFLELRKHLDSTRGTPDPGGVANLGNDPRHQWTLRSSLDIGARGEFDLMVRQVGGLPSPAVPRYTAVDARLAYQATPDLRAFAAGAEPVRPAPRGVQRRGRGEPDRAAGVPQSGLASLRTRR